MNKKNIITVLLALVTLAGQAQEARIDTIVPKFLINGYFFREMPKLPDATPSMTRLKDKEGCSCGNNTLPASSLQGKEITMGHLHISNLLPHPVFINKVDLSRTITW